MGILPKIENQPIQTGLNLLCLTGFLFWSAALPWAQVQETRFTSIALFVILGSWLFQLPFGFRLKPISPEFKALVMIFLFIGILPLLDFWRWRFPIESLKSFQLRLPFLFMPFLIWNFEEKWPENWVRLAFGSFGLSLLLTIAFSLFQGPSKIWNLLHSNHSADLELIIERPYYGLILGSVIPLFFFIFPKNRSFLFVLVPSILAFLVLILAKFALVSIFGVACLWGLFALFQTLQSQWQKRIFWMVTSSCLVIGLGCLVQSSLLQAVGTKEGIPTEQFGMAYTNSVNTRLVIWKAALEILRNDHNWIFGLGTENIQPALDAIYQRENVYVFQQHFNPHNLFLYFSLQYGIAGFILPVVWFMVMAFRGANSAKLSFLLIWTFVFFCMQTEVVINRELGVHFILWLALVLTFSDLNEKQLS